MENQLKKYKGIHPGFILRRIIEKRGLKAAEIVHSAGILKQNLSAFQKGKRGISTAAGLRLDEVLQLEEGTFALLQTFYEIQQAKNKSPQKSPDLSQLREALFWDTILENINWEEQADAVIKRVFERGNAIEKKEITQFYGEEKIRNTLGKFQASTSVF